MADQQSSLEQDRAERPHGPRPEVGRSAPGAAVQRAERERDRALDAQARFAFLAESSRLLSRSIEYEETLELVATLALPHLGAWCIVDVVESDGLRRLAVVHPDPAKQELARDLHERYPPESDDVLGVRRVIETGESEIVLEVPPGYLRAAARDDEHLRLLRRLGVAGYMTVPLRARDRVLGAITFVTAENGRVFGDSDLLLAEDLGRRCAMAIDNARLHQESQEANRAKMDFLAVISHELRTPITAMLGYTDLLEAEVAGPINETQRRHLGRIRVGSAHLVRLVDELLSYARLESGRSDLQWETVGLSEIVEGAIEVVRQDARDRGLPVEVAIPDELDLETDRRKLHYVLLNLLTNATKFTPEGRVRVRTREEGDEVVIEVEDTGIGISEEHQKRVFEPFWKADSGTTRTHGGSGIGLSLTRRLVEVLGGEISVESERGRGSTFSVRIPRRPRRPDLPG